MDATIYALVLHPALHDLLQVASGGAPVSDSDIGWYGGIVFSIFLVGWAIGGVLFGVVADYVGRTRTLIVTILIYAVFTGMAALSQDWWHLAIYRFLTALGTGGGWGAWAAPGGGGLPGGEGSQAGRAFSFTSGRGGFFPGPLSPPPPRVHRAGAPSC